MRAVLEDLILGLTVLCDDGRLWLDDSGGSVLERSDGSALDEFGAWSGLGSSLSFRYSFSSLQTQAVMGG